MTGSPESLDIVVRAWKSVPSRGHAGARQPPSTLPTVPRVHGLMNGGDGMTLPDASRRSRRAVLAGAIGGIAALVAQSVHRPAAVDAATGDIVKVGGSYTGTRTIFDNPTGTGVIGVTRGGVGRSGLKGESRTPFGYGVIGTSSSSADESGGVLGEGLGRGVIGHALGYGVEGISDAEGVGVYGRATNENGVGWSVRGLHPRRYGSHRRWTSLIQLLGHGANRVGAALCRRDARHTTRGKHSSPGHAAVRSWGRHDRRCPGSRERRCRFVHGPAVV